MGYDGRHTAGFTLLEVLLATFILGIVALAAIPSFTSGGGEKLDLAASELAAALRFARSEALRTGDLYGVGVLTAQETARVRHIQTPGDPFNTQPMVTHPIDKRPYVLDLAKLPFATGVQIDQITATHSGACTRPGVVAFDAGGQPLCGEPTDARVTQWEAKLVFDGTERTVSVTPGTGRVTVQ